MKRYLIITTLLLSLLLSACSNTANSENDNNDSDILNRLLEDFEQNINNSTDETSDETNFENVLIDVLGAEYFEGRAIIRAEDEEVLGEICAVFQVGTNTNERFTAEEWVAVSQNGQVYKYDVALDTWAEFAASSDVTVHAQQEQIQNCIYALNEVFSDSFTAEYYDAEDMMKKGVYESEAAIISYEDPALLIGLNEAVPEGYFADPAEKTYMPVYNFNSKAQITEHFSIYFTQNFLDDIQWNIDYNFLEYEGALYITRGGQGYGVFSVDFDNIYYNEMQDNTLIVPRLFNNDYTDARMKVKFAEENGSLKIDGYEFLLMYDLFNVSRDLEYVIVPDFRAYISDNQLPTSSDEFTASQTQENKYSITYLGNYYEELPKYVNLFHILGYNTVIDGHEGFYSFEMYEGDFTVTVNVYSLNEEDGIAIDVIKTQAVG